MDLNHFTTYTIFLLTKVAAPNLPFGKNTEESGSNCSTNFFLSHSLDDRKHHTHLEQKIKAGFPRFQTRSCLALVNDLSKKPLHEGLDLGGFFLGRLKGEAKKCLHCHPQKKTTTFFPIS